jgi:AraC family transcriptional regulator
MGLDHPGIPVEFDPRLRETVMDAQAIEAVIASRFRLAEAPTLVARVGPSKLPVVFTHLRSDEGGHRRTMDVPREQSFSFQAPLSAAFPWQAWLAGKPKSVPAAEPGCAYLFDLSNNPTVELDTPFSTVRLNISQAALEELAHEGGRRRPEGLRATSLGQPDPVVHGLAQTLAAAMRQPGEGTSLFADYIALAFHAHVLHAYGDVLAGPGSRRGGLAAWQLRRAREFIEVNLEGDPSIADIAAECGLSSSHFARAFKLTTGAPPHAWLSRRRIERAKQLLRETNLTLAETALACGFVDQSHLGRTFAKSEGYSPGRWRRLQRN